MDALRSLDSTHPRPHGLHIYRPRKDAIPSHREEQLLVAQELLGIISSHDKRTTYHTEWGIVECSADLQPASEAAPGDYSNLKVADLRAELTKRGADSKGKKPELVARLEALDKDGATAASDAGADAGAASEGTGMETGLREVATALSPASSGSDNENQWARELRLVLQLLPRYPEPELLHVKFGLQSQEPQVHHVKFPEAMPPTPRVSDAATPMYLA